MQFLPLKSLKTYTLNELEAYRRTIKEYYSVTSSNIQQALKVSLNDSKVYSEIIGVNPKAARKFKISKNKLEKYIRKNMRELEKANKILKYIDSVRRKNGIR